MYFIIIMAFALVLSDNLPPPQFNMFGSRPPGSGFPYLATLAIVVLQVAIVGLLAALARRRARRCLDGSNEGHEDAADTYADFQENLLFILGGALALTHLFTPWSIIVRHVWGLDRIPLLAELVILSPLFSSLVAVWTIVYPLELSLRSEPAEREGDASAAGGAAPAEPVAAGAAQPEERTIAMLNPARAALAASRGRHRKIDATLGNYLVDKLRHQVLILAVPMSLIVLAKDLIYLAAPHVTFLPREPNVRMLILHTALGTVSFFVLLFAPMMLRYIWATEPLPPGPLRDRFVETCRRIGLRYREILIWHTHGLAVNAAVMGFIAPLRYILVSDALLEEMNDEEIEAVFGHEAGHVRHWHLPFFGVFAIVSMYAAGGVMILLLMLRNPPKWLSATALPVAPWVTSEAMLQFVALVVLLVMWLFGFSWLSRKFERQADLFGIRCITPDVKQCQSWCPVHGESRKAGICVTAANIFGRTLGRIADLNGIPRESPSWQHGSIESRCKLIETFVSDTPRLERFEGTILGIKVALIVISVVGTVVAAIIYYPTVARALGWT